MLEILLGQRFTPDHQVMESSQQGQGGAPQKGLCRVGGSSALRILCENGSDRSQVLKRLKSGPSPQSRGTLGSYGSLTDASCFGHPRREDFGCGSIFYNPQKSQREGSCGRVKRGLGKPCLLIRLVLDRRQAGRNHEALEAQEREN